MTTEEFVLGFYREKQDLLQIYLDRLPLTTDAPQQRIVLRDGQRLTVPEFLENVLDNVFYATLLGLEGSASIGRTQTRYELRDPEGNSLNNGDLGGYAWQYFQNDGNEPD
jgi:AAA+ superfamily predicted ATPase